MVNNRIRSNKGRSTYILIRIRTILAALFIIIAVAASIGFSLRLRNNTTNERRDLLRVWNSGDYEQAYEISKNALIQKPVDYFFLSINGFSAYQLGISQINRQNTITYIDESIFSLRKALLHKESENDGRIYYVLGKAYGYKGAEYSDLAVKYLEIANNKGFEAQDIPEYLGLAYAAYGDYRSSVEAFSLAFIPGKPPSDNLLLSIARSYIAMNDYNLASGYLQRCIDYSPDSKTVVIARFLMAEINIASNDYYDAEIQFLSILNDTGENAEAHFQLGELYNLLGDTTRARSEWRTAFRQDPAHARARARLSI